MPSRRELANAVRALTMDAVQQANSGHPGAPMGMADIAEVLWNDFLTHNPANPGWPNRDRFVLSNGHGSMLLYSMLHLSGYDLPMEELRRFRQIHSRTPGHPEVGHTPGVETTTGPLGQGFANAVGMAIAERALAVHFNRPGHDIIDHLTWVAVGDGCLMEGISHEAASLAGTLGLDRLIAIYDSNGISIDGNVRSWFAEDVAARFKAYGWRVITGVDGHDAEQVKKALRKARRRDGRPTLLICRTVIGWGAPTKQGGHDCHGAPLGAEEVGRAREQLGWPHGPFEIPEQIYRAWDARRRGARAEKKWRRAFDAWAAAYPDLAAEFERRMAGRLPDGWAAAADAFIAATAERQDSIATRKASQAALDAYGPLLPELIGGSADLTWSNLTHWSGSIPFSAQGGGNYIYYGVREFAMAAINNGIALHGGLLPYGGTFLVFSDYARNALRMAALMGVRNIFVLTHDSIGLGEDGPTHQAVEHAASLRLIPNMAVWRPCDAAETAVAWKAAVERRDGPTCLLLSRQNVKPMSRTAGQTAEIARGGYVLLDGGAAPEAIIIATGSEVALAVEAAAELARQGRAVRVVSMPCTRVFDAQDAGYRERVLPRACRRRVAVEAGIPDYWYKYVGLDGRVLGVPRYGASAPGPEVYRHFGLTVEGVVDTVKSLFVAQDQ
jgi:transketolase